MEKGTPGNMCKHKWEAYRQYCNHGISQAHEEYDRLSALDCQKCREEEKKEGR